MKLKELKNTAVHCRTKAEYNRLMKIYEKAGWEWIGGGKPTGYRVWNAYKSKTCVDARNGFGYADIGWYRTGGQEVITFSEFLTAQDISSPTPIMKVKRPRGRPRKTPVVSVKPISEDQDEFMVAIAADSMNNTIEEIRILCDCSMPDALKVKLIRSLIN